MTPASMRGKVEDVVDDGEQRRARGHDVAGVLALLGIERADAGVGKQLGEADDVGERRAQFVGDVVDEGVLQAVGGFQRLVAVDQRALDLHGVGDVDEGHHRLPVGKRHGGVVDDAAVGPLHAAGNRGAGLLEPGDAGGEAPPHGLVVARAAAGGDDFGDVRAALQADRPSSCQIARERRIVQAQAAVGSEHRDAFVEMIERLALDADQRVVAALEIEPLGDVLVNPGGAALRMRVDDDAQRLPVGHVPPLLARLHRAVGGEQIGAPGTEVGLLGKLPLRAQAIEDGGFFRRGFEERDVEIEERAIGGVERAQTMVGTEDGDGGLQLVERAGVEIDLAAERRLRGFHFGDVDGDAGAAAFRRDVGDIEDAARAGDDRRQAFGEHGVGARAPRR